MNDPFSKHLRRMLPWSENQELHLALEKNTLIGVTQWDTEQACARIKQLEKVEVEFGFVFVGEKPWLIEACETSSSFTYEEWVYNQFNQVVFPTGMARLESSNRWQGYTENLSFYVTFPQLERGAAKVDNLLLTVTGDETRPAPNLLVDAFLIIHNLSYYLRDVAQGLRGEFFLQEIFWSEEIGLWKMELISECGYHNVDFAMKDGRWTWT